MLLMAKKRIAKEQVNIRVTPQLLDYLDRMGEPFGLTRSQIIHRAIEEYVSRHLQTQQETQQQQPPKQPPRQ